MARQGLTDSRTEDIVVPIAEVDGSRSAATWSVAARGWRELLPDLPEDVIAMLATPVVVTAEAFAAPRQTPDLTDVATATACAPRFLAPAPPKRLRPRRHA